MPIYLCYTVDHVVVDFGPDLHKDMEEYRYQVMSRMEHITSVIFEVETVIEGRPKRQIHDSVVISHTSLNDLMKKAYQIVQNKLQ